MAIAAVFGRMPARKQLSDRSWDAAWKRQAGERRIVPEASRQAPLHDAPRLRLAGGAAAVAAGGVAVVALLAIGALYDFVATTGTEFAPGCAFAIAAQILAVVALLARVSLDHAVATTSTVLAPGSA
jgi:hypothetical protein